MVFNSFIFIFLLLPLTLLSYFLFDKISSLVGKIVLIISSLLFYLYGGWQFFLITLASIAFNIVISLILGKINKGRKALFIVGIVINVLFLFVFKYTGFIANSIFNANDIRFNLALPLGISFYTFQQISYLSCVYQKKVEKVDIIDYLAFASFFPKMMIGPLVEYDVFVNQLNDKDRKKFNIENFLCGFKMFAFGLFKKVVLADTLALAVNYGFSNITDLQFIDTVVVTLSYTFQVYFDFSGYSDMAIGVAMMMNFDLPQNFNSPYRAYSVRDFWKRWHMSLTRFLTQYIYIPLGGNKKGTFRTCLNVLIVFLVSGIWHGANWTFILWGLIWGILSVIDRFLPRPKDTTQKIIGWMATFVIVNILWLLFRADSIGQWFEILKKLFSFTGLSLNNGLKSQFMPAFITPVKFLFGIDNGGVWLFAFLGLSSIICFFLKNNYQTRKDINIPYVLLSVVLFVFTLFCMTSESVFVYFGF